MKRQCPLSVECRMRIFVFMNARHVKDDLAVGSWHVIGEVWFVRVQ